MQTVNIEDIKISDRQRKDFKEGPMDSLKKSIQTRGLFHPIVLTAQFELVAGHRRLRAIQELWEEETPFIMHNSEKVDRGQIPFTYITKSDSSIYEKKASELEENLAREDLSWQEEAFAIAELHELKKKTTDARWTMADTAQIISGSESSPRDQAKVSESLIIAEHLDDPIVAAAKDRKQAVKAIKEKVQTERRIEATKNFDRSSSPHELIHGDCFEIDWKNTPTRYDVVITDPPYGRDMHKMGASFDGEEHEYDDSMENFNYIVETLPGLCTSITNPQAHCYIFCDIRRWPSLLEAFFLSGWWVWPKPLIWFKGNIGHFPNVELGPRGCYEAILYAIKGEKKVEKVAPDVICVNQSTKTLHPANKPADLYAELLSRSTIPGQSVIDLFAGSGPIFPASNKLGLIATGIEVSEKYYSMALSRISEEIT